MLLTFPFVCLIPSLLIYVAYLLITQGLLTFLPLILIGQGISTYTAIYIIRYGARENSKLLEKMVLEEIEQKSRT